MGLIPGWETKNPYAAQRSRKKNRIVSAETSKEKKKKACLENVKVTN